MVRIVFDEPAPVAAEDMPSVVLSDSAATRVAEILRENGYEKQSLRVRVDGGGCNGYSYHFGFDKNRAPDDIAIENLGITLLIDPLSFQYLKGSTVDFVETLEASQFVVKNPNAKSSCGCGNSFAI